MILTTEKVVDSFAGGGGASTGIEAALGRHVDIAINHNPEALALHEANHPLTEHLCESVWKVEPVQNTGLLWMSPDCTHFSKAKGCKPRSNKSRGLAWVAIYWAKVAKPRVIILENVEEFQDWGPLTGEGKPCPIRKGLTFRVWLGKLKAQGYVVEWRELRACDYGAPTSRKRLFVVARRDGEPIVWPVATHGPGRIPFRTAADCIDWSLPCPSIFGRKTPLAEPTLRRIARGIRKFVIDSAKPFIVPNLVAPTLIQTGYGEREGQAPRSLDLQAPLGTVVAGGAKHALVCAFLAKHYGGHETPGSSLTLPFGTVTTVDHHALVTATLGPDRSATVRAFLTKFYGTSTGQQVDLPLGTITSSGEHFGLVMVNGVAHHIADIGMRMLSPRELFRAQGFPDSYRIDPEYNGKPLTKTAQIRCCGNSVCPPLAEALVRSNFGIQDMREAAE